MHLIGGSRNQRGIAGLQTLDRGVDLRAERRGCAVQLVVEPRLEDAALGGVEIR